MKWGHPIYKEFDKNHNNIKYGGSKFAKGKKFVIIVKNPFGEKIGKGISTSKKKAEQLASKNALKTLKVIINDEIDPDWINKIEKEEKDEKEKEKNEKKTNLPSLTVEVDPDMLLDMLPLN